MRASIIFSLLFATLLAHAGDKGNGGYSVVCRSDAGEILSAELLDIYEGRVLYKRTYRDNPSLTVESIISKVQSYYAFYEKLKKEIAIIEKNVIMIPEGNELQPTDDAFPPIKKKGCEFEQVANYTNNGELLISEEIFRELDNTGQVALVLHEAIYAIRRKSVGDKTSEITRRLVAQLMASDGDPTVIDRWVLDSLHRPNNRMACGLQGTLEERIESCSYVHRGHYNMLLVMRTSNQKEFWIDRQTGLLWSDRLNGYHAFSSAESACLKVEEELGYLGGHSWRLPSAYEYNYYGETLLQVLPGFTQGGLAYWFWTSSPRGKNIQAYSGDTGSIGIYSQRSKGSVRCVSKL